MVKIRRHMAPLTRTSGRGNPCTYITIHETANRGRGAGAASHARLQAGTNSRQASWHYQVDDTRIIQSFDDNVKCWHAGAKANNESIAIEICVNSDGDYNKALDNAAALVAHLRKKHGIPWNRVVSHNFWTGKNCPTIMLGRSGQWDKFIAATDPKGATKVSSSSGSSSSSSSSSSSKSVSQMADEIIAGRHGSGHSNRQRSLGVNNATYQKVRDLVNQRAGVSTPSSSRPSKSVEAMANEIIAGRHGTGHAARQRSLGVSNSVYQQVRNRVNQKASGGSSSGGGKSISQMANEIIAGKHGNGHANRQRSLGVNNATYAAVRKEVNRRS
ncbi:MAG: N-acetylmuramoyl-L-alanine amidase [Yaniella sp.]|nr:N-acetylmuramoyl-L-alanine amidase [Yaniella sp.]